MKTVVKMVKVTDIIVDERFRIDLGDLTGLQDSIKEKGILQPITLSHDLHLLAGGRRYTAAVALGLLTIPALLRETTGELDAREVELIENLYRKDFTWQEQAKLIGRIHALSVEKDPTWSGRATAKMLEQNPMNISRALRLSSALEALPELTECKTADEAHTVIKKAEEEMFVQEMARRQKAQLDLPVAKGQTPLQKGIEATLRTASANYALGDTVVHVRDLRSGGHWDLIDLDLCAASEEDISLLLTDLHRAVKKDCWMLVWFMPEQHIEVLSLLLNSSWQPDLTPVLWLYGEGKSPDANKYLARGYEGFFLCKKGNPNIEKRGRLNTFTCNPAKDPYHPTQRPLMLMTEILKTLVPGNACILVPFAGSGHTLRAAYQEGCNVLGFGNDPAVRSQFLLQVEADAKKFLQKG